MFVRPQGYIQCLLVGSTASTHNCVYKKPPQGTLRVLLVLPALAILLFKLAGIKRRDGEYFSSVSTPAVSMLRSPLQSGHR